MTENLGLQAAAIVDEKIREYRSLQEELNAHRFDLGTLTAQRNENELVKQVRADGRVWRGHRFACFFLFSSDSPRWYSLLRLTMAAAYVFFSRPSRQVAPIR